MVNRRAFVAASLASMLAIRDTFAKEDSATAVSDYRSPFGYRSTAEQVTEGLNLSGRVALITGCSAGIGYETMRVLVMRGAEVLGLARTVDKAKEACAAVNDKDFKGRAIPYACEHTDFGSVVACAEAVKGTTKKIDMLICNAGVYGIPHLEQVNGLEKHFVINHLAHFILVNRLIDQVVAAEQGRVVVVGSDAYKAATEGIEFDNLSGRKEYDPGRMYGQSKLANGLFTHELARRLKNSAATANALTPGHVLTETVLKLHEAQNLDSKAHEKILEESKTREQGAATPCYVATHPDLRRVSGQYFKDCNVVIPGPHMRDDQMAQRLWRVSEELTARYIVKSKALG